MHCQRQTLPFMAGYEQEYVMSGKLSIILLTLVLGLLVFLILNPGWPCSYSKPQSVLEGPVVQDWVARYNWSDEHSIESAEAIALDGSGNVYVTGHSFGKRKGDYATVKYNTNGKQVWGARYDGPAGEDDAANAIAVDSSGNAYVTGRSSGGSSGDDYATIKYDGKGEQLWVARYDGPAGKDDTAYSIALDGSGNVYVTGYSSGTGSGEDYATIKYDGDGNQLWVARYDGPASGDDRAYAMIVAPSGSVCVTGYREGRTGDDYATIKYDSDGNQIWVARYNGPSDDADLAEAIAVDGSGNVYVTGSSVGTSTGYDYVTIKYDTNGNELWVARYDGPDEYHDHALAIAIGEGGDVYVTGMSRGRGLDYATLKYDSDGNQLWVARYSGPRCKWDKANAIAVDGSGNVYVTGSSAATVRVFPWQEYAYCDYATIKYTPA